MDLLTVQDSTAIGWAIQTPQDVPADDEWLSPTERSILDRLRIEKRRRDWRLGRWTAKAALSPLIDATTPAALSSLEIVAGPDGAPEVSMAGRPSPVSISISHSDGIGFVATAAPWFTVGCDAEAIEDRCGAFVTDYFTPAEIASIEAAGTRDRAVLVTLLWSAKESALKAFRSGLRADTRSVEVTLSGGSAAVNVGGWAAFTVGPNSLWGWWRRDGRHVLTIVANLPGAVPRRIQTHSYARSYAR